MEIILSGVTDSHSLTNVILWDTEWVTVPRTKQCYTRLLPRLMAVYVEENEVYLARGMPMAGRLDQIEYRPGCTMVYNVDGLLETGYIRSDPTLYTINYTRAHRKSDQE